MDIVLLLLRLIHIGAGIFWVGGAFVFFLFVAPSLSALQPPERKRFLDELLNGRRYSAAAAVTSTLTVLAGALLYLRVSGGLQAAWITSPTGLGFTFGAVAAIIAWILAPTMIVPTIGALDRLGSELLAAGRPPTPEEGARLGALNQRLQRVGQVTLVLLSVGVISMAVSRYLG